MDENIAEITVKLGGIILRKAEFVGDYNSVYMKVFEKMAEMSVLENMEFDFLEILGEMGG